MPEPKTRPWRCLNPKCADDPEGKPEHDFWAAEPVCDKCGADPRKDPKLKGMITPLVIIHLDPPHPIAPGVGLGFPLCDTTRRVHNLHVTGEQATSEPGVVNCPKCKEHEQFPRDAIEMDKSRVPLRIPGFPKSGCC